MNPITLAQADAIADRTLAKGREMKFQPLTVAILDAGGQLKVLKRSDGALIRDRDGTIIGSIGVTGDTSDNDEICLVDAVEAQGLVVDTGDPR